MGADMTIQKVEYVEKEFYFARRKHMGTWINTGMYKQVWKAIQKVNGKSLIGLLRLMQMQSSSLRS